MIFSILLFKRKADKHEKLYIVFLKFGWFISMFLLRHVAFCVGLIEDSDDKVFLWVKAEQMHSDGDVPELKG